MGGYDISFSVGNDYPLKGEIRFDCPTSTPPAAVPALRQKPPVKIGSLPRLGAWLIHLLLAIGAAVLVHLAIYFYGR